jgi:hypothetical protein
VARAAVLQEAFSRLSKSQLDKINKKSSNKVAKLLNIDLKGGDGKEQENKRK